MNESDPYRYMMKMNPYQGDRLKVLFVCSGGILRSATCAHWAAEHKGWNTRSCGILPQAVPPINQNLLDWADRIYCMEQMHFDALSQLKDGEWAEKVTMLGIPDNFPYRSPELIGIIAEKLREAG